MSITNLDDWKYGDVRDLLQVGKGPWDMCPWVLYNRNIFSVGCELPEKIYNNKILSNESGLRDTNSHLQNRLPLPMAFLVTSVHVLLTGSDRSRELFRHNYILEIQIGQKVYHQIPIEMIDSIDSMVLAEKPVTEGIQARPGYFPKNFPLAILQQQSYSTYLIGQGFTVDRLELSVLTALNGIMVRGIQ